MSAFWSTGAGPPAQVLGVLGILPRTT